MFNRIILADDHSLIRLGLVQILKDAFPHAFIKEVSNGESLVKEVMLHDWDLAISDLDMEGKGGLEALEQIKSFKPNLPVLILSIYPEDLYAVRVLKAGASGYLTKNSAPEDLIKAIQRIGLGKKYITPEIAERLVDIEHNKAPHESLSNREFEIFKLLANGQTIAQIADALSISVSTVSTHKSNIFEKLSLSTAADLTRYAISHHIIGSMG